MDWIELLNQIFHVCIIPLLGVLTFYFTSYLRAKAQEFTSQKDNETLTKYVNMLTDTITKCVIATNQTYVNNLKDKNAFDADAQKNAFKMTQDAVMAILSEDAKEVLTEAFGDLNIYINNLIEAEVKSNKQ